MTVLEEEEAFHPTMFVTSLQSMSTTEQKDEVPLGNCEARSFLSMATASMRNSPIMDQTTFSSLLPRHSVLQEKEQGPNCRADGPGGGDRTVGAVVGRQCHDISHG